MKIGSTFVKRYIISFFASLSLLCAYAQHSSCHSDVEKFLSKKFLLNKDFIQIDSILTIIREKDGIENDDFFHLGNIRVTKSSMGKDKYASVLPLVEEIKGLYTKGYGDNKQHESFLRKICQIYNIAKIEKDTILNTYAQLWELHNKNLTSSDTIDLKLLEQYCLKCSFAERYNIVENLRLQALQINKEMYGVESSQYKNALANIFENYDSWRLLGHVTDEVGKDIFQKSSPYKKEWIKLGNISKNIEDENYRNIYKSYATDLLYIENDTVCAIKLLEDYCEKIKEYYGSESEQYYDALNTIKNCYGSKEQIPLMKNMLTIAEKIWGKEHLNYQMILNELSVAQLETGNIGAAINSNNAIDENVMIDNLFVPLDSLEVSLSIDKSQMLLSHLSSKATMNSMYGNLNIANQINKEIIYSLLKDLNSPLSQMSFFSAYQEIINNYVTLNRVDSVLAFGAEIIPYIKDENIAIQFLISIDYACRNSDALKFTESILMENPSFERNSNYPAILECMAEIKGLNKDINGAIQLLQKALEIRGDSLTNKIRELVYEEIIYALNENYLEAFHLNREAESLIKKLPNYQNSTEYLSLLIRSCMEGFRIGEYKLVKTNGEFIQSQNIDISRLHSYFDYDLLSQAGSIFLILQIPMQDYVIVPLIETYYKLSQPKEAIALLTKYTNIMHESIYSLLSLTGPSTNKVANIQQIGIISQNTIQKNALNLNNDSICALAYNNALLTKQILLNASDNLKKLILNSEDNEIKNKYEDLIKTQSLMDNATYSGLSIDSLYQRKKTLEIQLSADSKLIGDYTKGLKCDWKEVQRNLHSKECAVEFTMYEENNEEYYCAIILTSTQSPIIIYICSGKDLEELKNPYSNFSATNLIWMPILSKLTDVQKIYFSPVGKIHLLGIENFTMEDGSLISEHYSLYRVSSTNKLVTKNKHNNIKSCVMYGGLVYDLDLQTIVEESQKYQLNRDFMASVDYSIADSINLRSGVVYLPSTKTEVEEIERILSEANIKTFTIQEKEGTESSFKALSGKNNNLLHIATHGFYWNEKESKRNLGLSFMAPFYKNNIDKEDQAMVRSGLLFAGANNALKGKHLPENVDDGILTAKEISTLDLRGLDLVVLSACQTGLGEITGDGVFGLQRGFKKAGAQTLMMSLWKVDDNATRLLMTQFYANLISGKSKFESLREAQRYVREYEVEATMDKDGRIILSAQAKEQARNQKDDKVTKKIKPYQNPKYWAAFILLDAID